MCGVLPVKRRKKQHGHLQEGRGHMGAGEKEEVAPTLEQRRKRSCGRQEEEEGASTDKEGCRARNRGERGRRSVMGARGASTINVHAARGPVA